MPRTSTVLQVFVASPSDVAEERAALDSVVLELNALWSQTLGVTFEVVKWETHTRPGFAEDAQAVINSQLPDDYDVFIGIFWSRLGTPTARSRSGSAEEFERALARFRSTGTSPEIMLYFKEAPLSPSRIDPQQFLSLQEFKATLQSQGGLFSPFEDAPSFEASLRAHLSAIARKFAAGAAPRTASSADNLLSPATVQSEVDEEDDLGLLDHLDVYMSRASDMTASMTLVNEATVRMGQQLTERAKELPAYGDATTAVKLKIAKRAAEDMLRYAGTLDTQLPGLSSARQEAFSSLSRAISLMADFKTDPAEITNLRSVLLETIRGAGGAKPALIGLRTAALSVPRISKDVNKAKRAVATSVERFLAEIETVESTVSNIVESLDMLLAQASLVLGE